jgi:hypothetical protein
MEIDNLKAKLLERNAQDLQSAVRAGKSGTGLLDDGESNIGNSTIIQPQILPTANSIAGPFYTTTPTLANNSRLLNLTASSKKGQSVTVVMTASRVSGAAGFVGPLVGIIEFGNGTVTTKVEFDIPIGPYTGTQNADAVGDTPQDSGAVIQVPSGIIRAFARYDNAYLQPEIDGSVPFQTQPQNPALIATAPNVQTPGPLQVKAFASYFGRVFSRLYLTRYLYSALGSPDKTTFNSTYTIPPFAKSVHVVRVPQIAAMTLTLWDSLPGFPASAILYDETYQIPSGISPIIPIMGNQNRFSLKSATNNPADAITAIKLVFEIGF